MEVKHGSSSFSHPDDVIRLGDDLGLPAGSRWVTHPTQAALLSELRVCQTTGGDYQTIQAAIDAAGPGDIIKVAAGEYPESKMVSGLPYNLYITKTSGNIRRLHLR